jgi:methyltransferase (TIGR00027 family)
MPGTKQHTPDNESSTKGQPMNNHTQADFTAGFVIEMLVALGRSPRWNRLLNPEDLKLYVAFAAACRAQDPCLRLIAALPAVLKLPLADFIFKGRAQHYALRKQAVARQARRSIAERGVEQFVVIGAGFDILAWQLAKEYPSVTCYELDLPATQQLKTQVLRDNAGGIPERLHFVPCDLQRHSLADILNAQCQGFSCDKPTFFLAEGVPMYLTEQENARLFKTVAAACTGGGAEFMFSALEPRNARRFFGEAVEEFVLQFRRANYRWLIGKNGIADFCRQHGLRLVETLEYAELQKPFRDAREMEQLRREHGEMLYYAVADGD